MQTSEAWAIALEWVNEHSRKICGYVSKRYLLDYSAYEMQDFLAEASLVAYEALINCGEIPFEAYFWVQFKNRCKTLANKPHKSKYTGSLGHVYAEVQDSTEYDDMVLVQYLSILTPKQREAFASPESLNISRQALQQRVHRGLETINMLKELLSLR